VQEREVKRERANPIENKVVDKLIADTEVSGS
jgi:hypothetical protein